MHLPEELRERWSNMARRLKEMPSDVFYRDGEYDPIRGDVAKLAWTVAPSDLELFKRVTALSPKLVPTPAWATEVSDEEVLSMLLTIISQERWSHGIAVEPHRNGFLSLAFERVANADGAFELRS